MFSCWDSEVWLLFYMLLFALSFCLDQRPYLYHNSSDALLCFFFFFFFLQINPLFLESCKTAWPMGRPSKGHSSIESDHRRSTGQCPEWVISAAHLWGLDNFPWQSWALWSFCSLWAISPKALASITSNNSWLSSLYLWFSSLCSKPIHPYASLTTPLRCFWEGNFPRSFAC